MTELLKLAERVVGQLKGLGLFITTVESCTGGGLANCITSIPGASDVIMGAWITYSAAEKRAIGVPDYLTTEAAVYSEETAVAMARAGMNTAVCADLAVGITGQLSFPDPDHKNRAYIAVVFGRETRCEEVLFPVECERWEAKEIVIEKALQLVSEIVKEA